MTRRRKWFCVPAGPRQKFGACYETYLFVGYGIKVYMALADVVQMIVSMFMPHMEEENKKEM